MTERWVIDGSQGWLNARAVTIRWPDERERLQYRGPILEREHPVTTQLRWMVNPPVIGLPTQPFVVWRNVHPGGNPSKRELANLPGWEPIEVVGLPVDDTWHDTPYSREKQGLFASRMPPVAAALRRLKIGAPPIGWTHLDIDGLALPDWRPPDVGEYLRGLLESRMMAGIHKMLATIPKATDQDAFLDKEEPRADLAVLPRLILDRSVDTSRLGQKSSSEWHPLRIMALSASSDPYAALALGFGTALVGIEGERTLLMVSVRHQLDPHGPEFELADVIRPFDPLPAPGEPTGLVTMLVNHTRPQKIDAPALDSIGVEWDRPSNPAYDAGSPDRPYPASYAIGRFGSERWRAELLLTERPADVGGWMPYVQGQGAAGEPALFIHHLPRATTIGSPPVVVPDVIGGSLTYTVAAQDLFGRYSRWQTVSFEAASEPPQAPRVLSSRLGHDGLLTVDFSWDWTDRSPQFMELIGAFVDEPGNRVLSVRCDFAGLPQPTTGVPQVQPLDQSLQPTTTWGGVQDKDPTEPAVRYYRLSATVPLSFGGKPWRDFQTQARGQCHAHHVLIPGFNVSPFGPASVTRVLDPAPPPAPAVPEAPQWASLPDAAGVSRAVLSWDGVGAKGYALYEATETALLGALGLPGPDTSEPFTARLARLRSAALPSKREVFRRVEPGLIQGAPGMKVDYEAALPRGSRVIHFFAVTAMSENDVESAWPDLSKKFIAVASPRLDTPVPPSIEARADVGATRIDLRIETHRTAPGGQVEIFRTTSEPLAGSIDTMGPPIATLDITGAVMSFTDTSAVPGWRRIWYRAVVWSARNDLDGIVESRSEASAAYSVFLPPPSGPAVVDIRVNEPRSTARDALVSWSAAAPVPDTPLGPFRAVLESRDAAGRLRVRLDQPASVPNLAALPGPELANNRTFRLEDASGVRFFGWVPRPNETLAFQVLLKIIDPLGRIGFGVALVTPLSAAPPVITSISPTDGRTGDSFTITGSDLVLRAGDPVTVRFEIPADDEDTDDPGPFPIVGETTPTRVVATIPDIVTHADAVRFRIILVRSDGKKAVSGDSFSVSIL